MKILIAPNSFKHSLSSLKVAEMLVKGFKRSRLESDYVIFPIADGGNGTLELVVDKLGAEIISFEVHDPLGRLIKSRLAYVASSETAFIEMAEASGIHLLKDFEKNPLIASSYGTGELIRHALDLGAKNIVLGLGGSASIDGGIGIMQALGVKFIDDNGNEIEKGGGALRKLESLDLGNLHPAIHKCQIIVACDVESPLLGARGAAAVFGPQKGAKEKDVRILEKNLKHFVGVVQRSCSIDIGDLPFGGAAGGVSAGLHGVLNAKLVNGVEYLLEITGFEKALTDADIVITAEGKFDAQTMEGKGPLGVANLAYKHNVPVIVFAGQVSDDIEGKKLDSIKAVFSISRGPVSLKEAISDTGKNLVNLAEQIGNLIEMIFRLKK